MDEIWTLISLSLAMLIGCYLSGLIPLAITFSEVQLFFYIFCNPLFKFNNSWSNPNWPKIMTFCQPLILSNWKSKFVYYQCATDWKITRQDVILLLTFYYLSSISYLKSLLLSLSEILLIILSSMICHLILIYPLCTILHIQLSIQTSVSFHLINISSRVMKAKVETSKKSSAISNLRHFPYNDKMMFSNIKKCYLLIIVWKVSTKSKHETRETVKMELIDVWINNWMCLR